jgi:hypothetical protein
MPGWLIPLALAGGSALANLFGAKKQAGAAKEAAATQSAAAEQARLLQQQMYQQTRADLAPYMQGGSQGLSALTSLLGVGGVAPSSGLAPLAPPPSAGVIAGPMGTTPGLPNLPAGMSATELAAWRRNPTQAGREQLLAQAGVNASAYPGGTVMLRAPTGQTQAVPAEQAEFFLARGATRV